MGCDMHAHIEVRLSVDGNWHHYSHPRVARDYELFGVICGVRREVDVPICQPVTKSLIDALDITDVTRIDWDDWRSDAHHPCILNRHGVGAAEEWCKQNRDWNLPFGYLFGNTIASQDSWPDGICDVRVILWFDN